MVSQMHIYSKWKHVEEKLEFTSYFCVKNGFDLQFFLTTHAFHFLYIEKKGLITFSLNDG